MKIMDQLKLSSSLLQKSALMCFLAAISTTSAFALESRSYVVGWFAQATYSQDDDCPDGIHPEIELQFVNNLEPLGYSKAERDEYRRKLLAGEPTDLMMIMATRGRIDGKPVNPYTNPAAVADPKLPELKGKYAFGFDLDGKDDNEKSGFIDPQTKEAGVDHELYRALGCARSFRGSLEGRPTYWAWAWGQTRDSQPAWVITITGEDLGKDGLRTIRVERALEHLVSNSDGSPRLDMTYRVDPDPRSRNEFRAVTKDGVLNLLEHHDFQILQNPMVAPELQLSNTHLRLSFNEDKSIKGFIGGYQPWEPFYFGIGQVSIGGELQVVGDVPAIYYLLKQHADADPDPVTGLNRAISVTYYIEAVPAFVLEPEETESKKTAQIKLGDLSQ